MENKTCKNCFAINIYEHEYTHQIMYICEIAKKGVGSLYSIPEWCPLRKEGKDETNMARSKHLGRL
jgi:hypothetical protein